MAKAKSALVDTRRVPSRHVDRFGNLMLGTIIRTDERSGQDWFIQGPRGWKKWKGVTS